MEKSSLFRSPWYTDWCVWLGILGTLAIVASPELRSTPIDLVVGVLFQWGLFAVVPAAIRRKVQTPKMAGVPAAPKSTLQARRDAQVDQFTKSFDEKSA